MKPSEFIADHKASPIKSDYGLSPLALATSRSRAICIERAGEITETNVTTPALSLRTQKS